MLDQDIYDVQNIIFPVKDKVGARKKVENLVAEMTHPNIDWKYMVSGLRSYLYDYIYEIEDYSSTVLPVIFHYLAEATQRKRGSTLRAADTFFDRYIFLIRKDISGDDDLNETTAYFDYAATEFCEILEEDSKDGFFLEGVNERILNCAELLLERKGDYNEIIHRLLNILILQYGIYVRNAVVSKKDELDKVKEIWRHDESEPEDDRDVLRKLLYSVSQTQYADTLKSLENLDNSNSREQLDSFRNIIDFTHNAKTWERICVISLDLIAQDVVTNEEYILHLLSYLVEKSQQGSDPQLQLFMSRTVASVCSILVQKNKTNLLRQVLNLVLPQLLREIERGGNYYSAFAAIYNLGKTIIATEKVYLVDHFVDMLVRSRFCFPSFTGIASDWSVMVNSSHLENIRTWMRLIELNPPLMKKLAASLIANLKLGGVFLKDTDVFQRDISRLLNSDYGKVFYLITSLAAVFPAFYHDIGATGNIRTFTERIDTNHQMNDMIHFIRKQVHVESSSRTVILLQRVMEFWMTGDRTVLEGLVPDEVYASLDHVYRLINLDRESVARRIYTEIRHDFPHLVNEKFWDFLSRVDKNRFVEAVKNHDFEDMDPDEKEDALGCFIEYFNSGFPAEMTKMLHHIAGMFDIDTSRKKIWRFVYEIPDDDFRQLFENVSRLDVSKVNVEKFITFLHIYRMIFDKYNFSDVRAVEKLELYAEQDLFDPVDGLFEALRGDDVFYALSVLLEQQYHLKWDVLLSDKVFEPVDTIEFKRHIAFGIPSMYGSYKERKFDTLKVFFHCNLIRQRLFESLIEKINIYPHEPVQYTNLKRVFKLFIQSFEVDGIANYEMRSVASLLDTPNCTLTQFRDIVKSLLDIHGEISDTFNDTFKFVSKMAVKNIGIENIHADFIPPDQPDNPEVIIDRFMRNQIMQSPLLQLMDNLLLRLKLHLAKVTGYVEDQVVLNKVDRRSYRGNLVQPIRKSESLEKMDELYVPLWEAGAKAQGLVIAANMDGINVPDGIVLSADIYKRVKDGNINNPRFKRKLIYMLKKYIDQFTNYRFGNPHKPMLLSVRSGAVFSMPGVMDTITNVGITQEIVETLTGLDEWFAYDCYRRLIHDFAISFFDMDRWVFEDLISQAKEEAGVPLKEQLSGKQMEILTKKYRFAINREGHSIPKDPYEQLFYAIIAVYKSWDSQLARDYRNFVNISDEWGTSVVVQRMVFGNLSPVSITGVVHSKYIGYENISLFGEYKTRAQGHDIVSGVARVFPISDEQKRKHSQSAQYPSLESTYPGHYKKLFEAVKCIRDRWNNDVEIEFTFENDVLYVLQVRGMTHHVFETEELVETPEELKEYLLGQGLAASGGAVSGRAVFSLDRIDTLRMRYPRGRLIFIRAETNPEDVVGLQKTDGILTSVGGMTSHAVLQMRRLEKAGVSDFSIMKTNERDGMAVINRETQEKGKVVIREGDFLTIDGNNGNVYLGYHETKKRRV